MLLELFSGRPSDTNILIGRILMFVVGALIGIWWGIAPKSFWQYFKYLFAFVVALSIVSFFSDKKDRKN